MNTSLPVLPLFTLLVGLSLPALAQHDELPRPPKWEDLVLGGRFMDRLEPMPLLGKRTADTWGVDAVKPRDVLNGIEDDEYSYWGGNIALDEEGRYHLFVCRWREDHPKGHMAWLESEVVRSVSKNRFGPYEVAEVLGPGHNPEVYRLKDGRHICYVFKPKEVGYYLGKSIAGPWERKEFRFDSRDRKVRAGLSNLSFAPREDGSWLMVNRGGGMWISRDGLSVWEQVTQSSQYPGAVDRGHFEDPVIWRTRVQYHMIVNDWHGRIAYHLRSKDGFHWKTDPGEAYSTDFAISEDGNSDQWYKYERMRVLQDEHRRPIQANFAVIDSNKWEDKPKDIHSSKNISIPLTPGRLLTLEHKDKITDETSELRLRIAAEPGFDPHQDIDAKSLRFGAPEEVNFGRGAFLLGTEREGKDLIAVFVGKGCGFEDHNFAGKLLGKTSKGGLLFGYCRLPWVEYEEPKLSVRRPVVALRDESYVLKIEIQNHGLRASDPSKVRVEVENLPDLQVLAPALEPYEKAWLEIPLPGTFKPGSVHHLRVITDPDKQQPTVFEVRGLEIPKQ